MVNDTSMAVRAKASRLLGSLQNVSTQFLMQAFSKELFGSKKNFKLSRTKSNDVSAAGDFDLSQVRLGKYCLNGILLFTIHGSVPI